MSGGSNSLARLALPVVFASTAAAGTLDIYDIDAEGGAAVLFVSPTGQSVLIDTGNAGSRDALRIAQAAKVAGLTQIDYLVLTHYHSDHVGGFLELAKLLPIKHYVDHGPTVQPEQSSESKRAYDAATGKDHLIVKPGDKLPVAGIDWTRGGPANLDRFRGRDKWNSAGYAAAASG